MSSGAAESVSLPIEFDEFDDIVDVRTPDEFAEDHLPGAINLPVLDNAQRIEVGTLYKHAPFEARRLGARYISANIACHLEGPLAARPKTWAPLLYCWRGGMRSSSMATVLRSVGWRARTLEGGYKSFRRFVMAELDRLASAPRLQLHVIAGLTGSGKTRLLERLAHAGAQVLDLEGLANHRGSLLGHMGRQPGQKRFESLLYSDLSRFDFDRPVFVEAESSRIGRVYVPPALWRKLAEGTVHELILPLAERVKVLLEDYEHFPRDPERLSSLLDELRRLRGHEQVDEWQELITAGNWPAFVASILEEHYDRCYRVPGSESSVYQVPVRRIEPADASPSGLDAAAAELISNTGCATEAEA